MGIIKDLVIILKGRKFQDSDKIITFLGYKYGKAKAIAKGALKTTSRKTSSLEVCYICKIALAEGKNLNIITEIQQILPQKFKSKFAKYYLYIGEIIDRYLSENQPDPILFKEIAKQINTIPQSRNPLYNLNEIHLLLIKYSGILSIQKRDKSTSKNTIYDYLIGHKETKNDFEKEEKIFKDLNLYSEHFLEKRIISKELIKPVEQLGLNDLISF